MQRILGQEDACALKVFCPAALYQLDCIFIAQLPGGGGLHVLSHTPQRGRDFHQGFVHVLSLCGMTLPHH